MGRETGGKTGNRGEAAGSVERAGQLPEQMVIKALRMSHYQREQQPLSSQNATAHPCNIFITAAANYVNQKLWF